MTARLQTYSLLGARSDPPSEYEIVTSHLTPHVERGFEVDVRLADWFARYQRGTRLRCTSWESFADPRETTYARYTRQRAEQEHELELALQSSASSPDSGWRSRAAVALSAVRFPFHGFHMIAAYVAQLAPSGRITLAAMFQTADELRRIERVAHQLRWTSADDGIDADGRRLWQRAAPWQPLRETVERLLVTYDWGEAFVGFALCVAPMIDDLVTIQWARAAAVAGDHRLAAILRSLAVDCRWHRAWSAALVRLALADTPSSRAPIAEWIERWAPRARAAVRALAPTFCDADDTEAAVAAIEASHRAYLAEASLEDARP
jgi:toluene monooxygenase system protein E